MGAASGSSPARELNVPAAWPGHLCPNFSDWELGDIALVHHDQSAMGRVIVAGQKISANPLMTAGALCSHAAIYVGNGLILDATFGNKVMERSVWGYCQHRSIQLRRLNMPRVTTAQRHDIAAEAQNYLHQSYSLWEAIVSKLVPRRTPRRRSLYCSTLVSFAVADATGLDLALLPSWRPLYPAVLATHPWLIDVPLEWRQV